MDKVIRIDKKLETPTKDTKKNKICIRCGMEFDSIKEDMSENECNACFFQLWK